jgi:hypothetical protein
MPPPGCTGVGKIRATKIGGPLPLYKGFSPASVEKRSPACYKLREKQEDFPWKQTGFNGRRPTKKSGPHFGKRIFLTPGYGLGPEPSLTFNFFPAFSQPL